MKPLRRLAKRLLIGTVNSASTRRKPLLFVKITRPLAGLRVTDSPDEPFANCTNRHNVEGTFRLRESITIDKLGNALTRMKPRQSGRPDGMAPDPAFQLTKQLKVQLQAVQDESWTPSWCPHYWRNAVSCPILKKRKNTQDMANHRPTALTSALSKLFVRLIANRLVW